MKYKINLHTHTDEDPQDFVNYSIYECLNTASSLGFGAIALTCHNKFINNDEYIKYAESKGILLISGIEKTIQKRHIVILGCGVNIENIQTFNGLREYKKLNPNIFIIAAHPCFPGGYSLTEKELISNKGLFDAIEYSWFYTKYINFSKSGAVLAESLGIPIVATSDTHELQLLNSGYITIELGEKTPSAIFESIRRGAFKNFSEPQTFHRVVVSYTKGKFNTTLKRLGLKSAN